MNDQEDRNNYGDYGVPDFSTVHNNHHEESKVDHYGEISDDPADEDSEEIREIDNSALDLDMPSAIPSSAKPQQIDTHDVLLDQVEEKISRAFHCLVTHKPRGLAHNIYGRYPLYWVRIKKFILRWLNMSNWKDRLFLTRIISLWRSSMQFRVVTSTLMLSAAVMTILAFILMNLVISHVLNSRITIASEEIIREKVNVEENLSSTLSKGEEYRLSNALRALNTFTGQVGENSGVFDFHTVLIPRDRSKAVGPIEEVPVELIDYVSQTHLPSYQYSTVNGSSPSNSVLVLGVPINSDIDGLAIYLIYSLKDPVETVQVVKNTLIYGAFFLALFLAGIAYVVSRQIVLPIRLAARSADRFASGHLDERIVVHGVDDIAKLARAFNEMAESVSQQINDLEEYGNLQRRFTSDVSHELRTPLTTIRMATDVLYDYKDELENPMILRSTELLIAEVDRFENLLKDLLEISRHDAGVADLAVDIIDIAQPIKQCITALQPLAEKAHTRIRLDVPPQVVEAEIDQRRVERIIRNLVANAIDHGEGKPIDIQLRATDSTVAIAVRDYGIGLKAGQEKLVFNRFWRADPSRFRRSGGTGLGLAISSEDAKLHKGYLTAWGKPGEGSCFCLILPRYSNSSVLLDIPVLSYPIGKLNWINTLEAKSMSGKTSITSDAMMENK